MTNFRILACAALGAVLTAVAATAQQKEHRLIVTNGTDVAIEYFYFASCGAGEWGRDRLGAKEIIKPGSRKVFSIKGRNSDCCHDLRAKLLTGASRQKLGTDICREPEWLIQ